MDITYDAYVIMVESTTGTGTNYYQTLRWMSMSLCSLQSRMWFLSFWLKHNPWSPSSRNIAQTSCAWNAHDTEYNTAQQVPTAVLICLQMYINHMALTVPIWQLSTLNKFPYHRIIPHAWGEKQMSVASTIRPAKWQFSHELLAMLVDSDVVTTKLTKPRF